ncbi:GCN5 family acetyltransferase [Arthrobacter sp. Soil782]|uniref:bifunctional acetate--CoA ligase family protein/GNAT family N-acetyltransferase n=1 Tax=Arthrobacter sp. Soil782 TaxID=1736410 RepID=UPI0006FCDEA9|nr:bifunctional GNAT family N-acetyltransferase/acetate--CoA ligase family protein [Arthrobacter sp. Soil782]KRF06166.1 GCN5 family acetyltransferase [Arthrobacter sp. Soil782]
MVADGLYPEYWEADVVLRDGSTGHLRPISPLDADAVQAFHMRQSQNSIYLRFFTYKASLSAKELKRFTEVDHAGRVAFVVTRGQDIIGIGRYDRLDDPDEAEVAFNVSDAYQGRGLGSILLEHLAVAARENGIRRFTAEVLPENRKMITVFAEAGYEVDRRFDDGVVELTFNIDPTDKSREVMEAREHRAEARSMQTLLAPSSVAVIGASRSWGSVGYSLLEHIVDGGFTGPVAGVNPEAFELNGMVAYGSIAEIPHPVDLAVIAVPYDQVLAVAGECGRAGVKGLLVATAGFADDDGEGLARQRALVHSARSYGMRVVGPASLGIINTDPAVRLNASMAPELPERGGLGLFSQSAAIGVMLHAAASRRAIGLSSALSAGNRADVSGNDAMQYWEDDPNTRAVALYLESIGNPRKFSRIARRLSRMKPVIVAKSDVMGLQLPPGHAVRTTQAPSGALDAMLRQSGVIRVETTEQLMDVAQIVVGQPVPGGTGVAVFSNSLALGKVLADAALAQELNVVRLNAHLDLDAGQSVALSALKTAFTEALADAEVHSLILTLIPVVGLSFEAILPVLQECGAAAAKPVVACFTGVLDPAAQLEGLRAARGTYPRRGDEPGDGDASVPCFASPGAAVSALGAVVRYGRWREREHGVFAELDSVDEEGAAALLGSVLSDVRDVGLRRLDSGQLHELLDCYGINVLPSIPFDSADEAVEAADSLGWPVALKTVEENLRHRLDFGGVRLNIPDASGLRAGIEAMRAELRPFGSPGLEVQPMAPPGQACVIRAIEDPLLGPVVSFGMAGDAVNLLDDWAHGIPPLTTSDAADLLRTPRASRRLFGYQGLPPVDVPAIEDLLLRVALLKDRHPEISLLRFNPVLVSASGLAVLSAEISVGNPQQRTDSARRAMRD